jgi:hypothetical protein
MIQIAQLLKSASNLLVKTENDGVRGCINEASAKNVANAAREHEIVVPLASQ